MKAFLNKVREVLGTVGLLTRYHRPSVRTSPPPLSTSARSACRPYRADADWWAGRLWLERVAASVILQLSCCEECPAAEEHDSDPRELEPREHVDQPKAAAAANLRPTAWTASCSLLDPAARVQEAGLCAGLIGDGEAQEQGG